jgi:hypothetical protein
MHRSNSRLAYLSSIWEQAKKNKQAKKAIEILKQEGMDLETMRHAIAVIPLLPKRRARSRLLPLPKGAWRVVRFLREMAEFAATPYSEVQVRDEQGIMYYGRGVVRELLKSGQLADSLEKALGCHWVVTEVNARQNAVATLYWEVNERISRPHDRELFDVLHAVFAAAGKKFPWEKSVDALRKSVDHELHVRQAASRKVSR